jgi:glycine cleavage system protein P-like pyridoxal-binding family
MQSGVQLAIEATEQSSKADILRYVERIHTIDQHLEKRERQIGKARKLLREALYGERVIGY